MSPSPMLSSALTKPSAIQDFPSEILLQIFSMAVVGDLLSEPASSDPPLTNTLLSDSADNQQNRRKTFPTDVAPRNVSLVCKHWRDVVLHSSSIWSAIVLNERTLHQHGSPGGFLANMRDSLSKSKVTLLTLSASLGKQGIQRLSTESIQHIGRVFQQYVDAASEDRRRWRKINLDTYLGDHYLMTSHLKFADLPELEDLTLRFPIPSRRDATNNKRSIQVDLSSSTRLERVKLDGEFEVIVAAGSHFEKLKHFEYWRGKDARFSLQAPFHASTVIGLLQVAPALVSLVVDIFPCSNSVFARTASITLPRLCKLRIRTYDKASSVLPEVGTMLDQLVLPALKYLDVELSEQLDIPALVKRSGDCRLRSLVVDGSRNFHAGGVAMTNDTLLHWLRAVPSLEHLRLVHVAVSEATFKRMTLAVPLRLTPGAIDSLIQFLATPIDVEAGRNAVRDLFESPSPPPPPSTPCPDAPPVEKSREEVLCPALANGAIDIYECDLDEGELSGPFFAKIVMLASRSSASMRAKAKEFEREYGIMGKDEEERPLERWVREGLLT